MQGKYQPLQQRPPSRFRKVLSIVLSKRLWQRMLFCTVYFSASLIVLNDLFLLLSRTFFPNFLPEARVIVLEKLLQSLAVIFRVAG